MLPLVAAMAMACLSCQQAAGQDGSYHRYLGPPWSFSETIQYTFVDGGVQFGWTDATGIPDYPIPSTMLTPAGWLPVVAIGDNAFGHFRFPALISVVIPSTVKTIGNNAFFGCINLQSVSIPSSVTDIGSAAFGTCGSLPSITIPESVVTLGGSMFSGCGNLTSVTLPSTLTAIPSLLFSGCAKLTDIIIPSGVTIIGDSAFSGCTGLTTLKIPQGVELIGSYTFSGCTGLKEITIPSSVTAFGQYTFYNCSSLTAVYYLGNAPSVAGSAYSFYWGAPVTSYVERTSTGWNGPGSTTLPAQWWYAPIAYRSGKGSSSNGTPYEWLDDLFPNMGGDYDSLDNLIGENGVPIWESYIAGLDPHDPASRFVITNFVVSGSVVTDLRWSPDHTHAAPPNNRVYTVVGKTNLSDAAWIPTNSATRFFLIRASLPK